MCSRQPTHRAAGSLSAVHFLVSWGSRHLRLPRPHDTSFANSGLVLAILTTGQANTKIYSQDSPGFGFRYVLWIW
jgi:hypothetical protein